MRFRLGLCFWLCTGWFMPAAADDSRHTLPDFQRIVLSETFCSEGAAVGDIDGDGRPDIVVGPFWYAGPDFQRARPYRDVKPFSIVGYSDNFFTFTYDFDADGRTDILTIGFPGQPAYWYRNPGHSAELWARRLAVDVVDNESPQLVDMTGDGVPELLCSQGGQFGYAAFDRARPEQAWTFRPVTPPRDYGPFTHGLGAGDVNGDGRVDLLETNGWWEQPAGGGDALWTFHPFRFAQVGGAQMHVYDLDGDGDNDVISSQNAHGFGLSWFEQQSRDGGLDFVEHRVLGETPAENPYGVVFSQLHALELADIDGDGIRDLVTGKRFWAHQGHDVDARGLQVLYWFRTTRTADGVEFIPYEIDDRSGVGTEVVVADLNQDDRPDIVVGNKMGAFAFVQQARRLTTAEWLARQPQRRPGDVPAGDPFASQVRPTPHLSPAEEQRRLRVPPGFEVQLVAAEPEIAKPMNLAFDARGRLWVTDTVEYPTPAPADRPGRDSIKILEDTDGDGRADKITTFAEGLNIPIGIAPCRDGAIAWSIPNLWRFYDDDDDGRADRREKLYGPMGFERDTHGMNNAFRRGFDGWFYACHGFNNETRVAGADGHEVSMQSGNTYRFRGDGSRIEQFTWGQVNPFGMTLDPFGNLYTADCHSKPVYVLLRGGYYPSFGKPHDGLGFVHPIMEHLHGSTAIAGVAYYTGRQFPPAYRENLFSGNVMTSRVNRNSLTYQGSTATAREEPDFVISRDPWFRPVDIQVGPDGALYVADFYNRIIGHYEVPLDHPGRDRTSGRIWRIVYTGNNAASQPPRLPPALDAAGVPALVAALDDPVLPRRLAAADELVERVGRAAVEAVRGRLSGAGSPTGRAHALWVLWRLKSLDEAQLVAAAGDPERLVRVHAMKVLSETDDWSPALRSAAVAGLGDADPRVRRAAADALGTHPDPSFVGPLLSALPEVADGDHHLRHTLRMALRNQLRQPEALEAAAALSLNAIEQRELAEIMLGIRSPRAGALLVDYLDEGEPPAERVGEFLTHAAQFAPADRVESLVRIARQRVRHDTDQQLRLLASIRLGLAQRAQSPPAALNDWAAELALRLLSGASAGPQWKALPTGQRPQPSAPWTLQQRACGDGTTAWLISSHPRGEELTGTLQSPVFELPPSFSFYLAGHDGFPDQPARGENRVRLVDAESGRELARAAAPRSDTARRIVWQLESLAGRPVQLELVDGLALSGYAWLAAGRFSVEALNAPPDARFGPESGVSPLAWSPAPLPGGPAGPNPWAIQPRPSADGVPAARFFSSLPRGEQLTGIWRSEPFPIPAELNFFVAGHNGRPDRDDPPRNFVRLRSAETHALLVEATPPRHDTAARQVWQLAEHAGQTGYLELVDGDDRKAFAWLAVGRFSLPQLNPSSRFQDVEKAVALVELLPQPELAPRLVELLGQERSQVLRAMLAKALLAVDPEPRLAAVVAAWNQQWLPEPLPQRIVAALSAREPEATEALVGDVMQVLPARTQQIVAATLAGDRNAARTLLDLVDRGRCGAALLQRPEVAQKLEAFDDAELNSRIQALTAQLASPDDAVRKLIAARHASFERRAGSPELGRAVFEKHCAACHQLGGKGAVVGPQLDGIGGRGLERLLEDTLDPNRNVDVAFRTSTLVLADGRVLSGLVRQQDEPAIELVDQKGQIHRVAKDEIEQQRASRLSLMPANFGEVLSEQEFHHLIALLLSQRK